MATSPSACSDDPSVLSCEPQSGAVILQNDWTSVVWNAQRPSFQAYQYLDLHLYYAHSNEVAYVWESIPNSDQALAVQADDAWFASETAFQVGATSTLSYYFLIASAGADLSGREPHQATFTVIQTAAPITLAQRLASESSASAAAATSTGMPISLTTLPGGSVSTVILPLPTASISTGTSISLITSGNSVLSSLIPFTTTIPPSGSLTTFTSGGSIYTTLLPASNGRTSSTGGSSNMPGSLQPQANHAGLPDWAIGVMAALGTLLLLTALLCLWLFFCLAARKRKQLRRSPSDGSPNMTERGILGSAGLSGMAAASRARKQSQSRQSPEGAALLPATSGSTDRESAGLSAGEAAAITEAFRNTLRRPSFAHEGISNDSDPSSHASANNHSDQRTAGDRSSQALSRMSLLEPHTSDADRLLREELAGESLGTVAKQPELVPTP